MVEIHADGIIRCCCTDADVLYGVVELLILHQMEDRDTGSTRDVSDCALNKATHNIIKDAELRSRIRRAAAQLVNDGKSKND